MEGSLKKFVWQYTIISVSEYIRLISSDLINLDLGKLKF